MSDLCSVGDGKVEYDQIKGNFDTLDADVVISEIEKVVWPNEDRKNSRKRGFFESFEKEFSLNGSVEEKMNRFFVVRRETYVKDFAEMFQRQNEVKFCLLHGCRGAGKTSFLIQLKEELVKSYDVIL